MMTLRQCRENLRRLTTSVRLFSFDHLAVCLLIAAVGWLLILIAGRLSMFEPLKSAFRDFSMTDVYYNVRHTANAELSDDIVIVDVRELTARGDIAEVIASIKQCRPKLLCVDLIFERPTADIAGDASLISSIQDDGCPQVLSCKLTDYTLAEGWFRNCCFSFFNGEDSIEADWAYCNYRQDRQGGITRWVSKGQSLNGTDVFSLSYMAACRYKGTMPERSARNDYHIMYDDVDFLVVKGSDVLQHADLLRDKLVLLGAVGEESDMHFTPIGKMAGIKVVAYSILTFLEGSDMEQTGVLLSLIIALIVCYASACVAYRIGQSKYILSAMMIKAFNFLLAAVLMWIAFELYINHVCELNLLYPLMGIALVESVRGLYADIVKWLSTKRRFAFLKKSVYAAKNET